MLKLYSAVILGFAAAAAPTLAQVNADDHIHCSSCKNWNQPQRPFSVFGNTYYVGTADLSAILIADDAGLILIDGGLPQSAPLIDANIRELGFRTEDIRWILNSHTHFDHAGGIAALQRASGATVAASPDAAAALRKGGPTADDPQFETENNSFPQVSNIREIKEGEVIELGNAKLRAHFTPGHTPGGTTWSWQTCEGEQCMNTVYADSLSAVSADEFRFSDDKSTPSIVDVFKNSIRIVENLPCDILLSPHSGFFNMQAKSNSREAGRTDAFVESDGCRRYAANAMEYLERRLQSEQRLQQKEKREKEEGLNAQTEYCGSNLKVLGYYFLCLQHAGLDDTL